ncbi:MAG TPA: zinc ribbon domain-containing protein [Dehalococcoidia bacterium]|nr:zinc ribbon domain-containing protein [Dehalococcoidia bacterium]
MPLYEYVCDRCETRFEALRPASRMNDPAECPGGHAKSHRVLSNFAAVTKDPYGSPEPVAGGGCGGGCDNCSCSTN